MMNGFGPARHRCLELLRERQAQGTGADTRELCSPLVGGEEGTRRVRELRELGHPIRCRVLPTGYWYYWLTDEPDNGRQIALFD